MKCRGAKDLFTQDVAKLHHTEEVFREISIRWGYSEIKTPVIEYFHLFTSAGTLTPDRLSKVYSFLDWDGWSGERVVLRPDGTIPVARFYIENLLQRPVARLFYLENMFSFEETGEKPREQWQCGVELIGKTGIAGDIELILLGTEILRELGIESVKVCLSHAGILRSLSENLGQEGIKEALRLKGESQNFPKNIESILTQRGKDVKSHFDNLLKVVEFLDVVGQDYEIDFTLGKEFEYYTGIVFQFQASGEIVGSGGRYDELIPLLGGGKVPASGFALYADKLLGLIKWEEPHQQKIFVKGDSSEIQTFKHCFEVAQALRKQGYITEMSLDIEDIKDSQWLLFVKTNGEKLALDIINPKSNEIEFQNATLAQSLKWLALRT